jgi:hypothetical protein
MASSRAADRRFGVTPTRSRRGDRAAPPASGALRSSAGVAYRFWKGLREARSRLRPARGSRARASRSLRSPPHVDRKRSYACCRLPPGSRGPLSASRCDGTRLAPMSHNKRLRSRVSYWLINSCTRGAMVSRRVPCAKRYVRNRAPIAGGHLARLAIGLVAAKGKRSMPGGTR